MTLYRQNKATGRFETAGRSAWLTFAQTLIAAIVITIVAALAATVIVAVFMVATNHNVAPNALRGNSDALMRQVDYPCQEDQALMYAAVDAFERYGRNAPALARDYVACVNLDLLANNAVQEAIQFCASYQGYAVGVQSDGRPLCFRSAR